MREAPPDALIGRAAEMAGQLRAALTARPGAPGRESAPPELAGEETSARVRAALTLAEGLGGAAQARVCAAADQAILVLPIGDAARVHRAVIAPSTETLDAALVTLRLFEPTSRYQASMAALLGRALPLLDAAACDELLTRWFEEAFSQAPHAARALIFEAIAPRLPVPLFDEAIARLRREGPDRLHLFVKLVILDPHPSREALLEECLALCLAEELPWNFDGLRTLVPYFCARQLLRLASAFRLVLTPERCAQWGRRRGPPEVGALIDALARRGEGDEAIALLPFVPKPAYLGQRTRLLHHLPAPERLPLAQELLAFVRSPETWSALSAQLLADFAPHAEALGLRAELLAEILRLTAEHRPWVFQHVPSLGGDDDTPDEALLEAITRHDHELPPAWTPMLPWLLAPEQLALHWSSWVSRLDRWPTHDLSAALYGQQASIRALAGEAGVEAVALTLIDERHDIS